MRAWLGVGLMLTEPMPEGVSGVVVVGFPRSMHGNSLSTRKPAEGYSLRSQATGEELKFGETTRGVRRYTTGYLREQGADMVFEARGTKGSRRNKLRVGPAPRSSVSPVTAPENAENDHSVDFAPGENKDLAANLMFWTDECPRTCLTSSRS